MNNSKKTLLTALLLFISSLFLLLPAGIAAESGATATSTGVIGQILVFAGFFLTGLALNLTPCVYPMMAVTVSIFGGQTSKNPLTAFSKALLYVLGIATMYSVLGVAAAMTGGLFGSALQSPYVLLAVALLFFVLSLSMFGLYELQLPTGMMSGLGKLRMPGLIGIYLSGLFVGVFAAPCVGPPISALLAIIGQKADPFYGFMSFFVLSLGLGFPYLILGTFSGLLTKMPRSGAWMIWVKKLMGIILICFAIFYLSLAFYPKLIYTAIPVALISGAVYLSFFEKTKAVSKTFRFIKLAVLIIALLVAGVFFKKGREKSSDWQSFTNEAFEEATKNNKPTIVYFSASWCLPCQQLDRFTFTDQGVMRELDKFNRLKVDMTKSDSPEAKEAVEFFKARGVPTLIFFDTSGSEYGNSRTIGYLPPESFLAHLSNLGAIESDNISKDEYEEDELLPSEGSLISDVNWIVPDKPFKVGFLIDMREGWHAYWLNPGESGEPPHIEWDIPEGFEAGPIEWPAPESFGEPPFVSYGHADKLLLARKITPPSNLQAGDTYHIRIDADWLLCEESCFAQDGSFTLTLTVKETKEGVASEHLELFEETAKKIPVRETGWKFKALRKDDDPKTTFIVIFPDMEEVMKPPRAKDDLWDIPRYRCRNSFNTWLFYPSEPGKIETVKREGYISFNCYYWFRLVHFENVTIERVKGVLVTPHGLFETDTPVQVFEEEEKFRKEFRVFAPQPEN
ncbi:MAG: thioredoxin fold domain-containing protein [Lentisphaerae bacterium]|nr:thioredoxin fold domain-containing protein [Lentisphaerota bacterium]